MLFKCKFEEPVDGRKLQARWMCLSQVALQRYKIFHVCHRKSNPSGVNMKSNFLCMAHLNIKYSKLVSFSWSFLVNQNVTNQFWFLMRGSDHEQGTAHICHNLATDVFTQTLQNAKMCQMQITENWIQEVSGRFSGGKGEMGLRHR